MPRPKPRGGLERSALEDLWKHTLSKIPTMYGQLSYLASLRDANSGTYRHYGLFLTHGRENAQAALQRVHAELFVKWLDLPLAAKSSDLADYLGSQDEPRAVVLRHWKKSKAYRSFIPELASRAQSADFLVDVELVLQLMD